MLILLRIAKYGLRFLYLFLRPLRVRNKVVFFSRQSSEIPLDFRLLAEELGRQSPETEVRYFCRKMRRRTTWLHTPCLSCGACTTWPPPRWRYRYLFHPTVHPGVQAGPDHCPDLGTPWGR